MTEEEFLSVKGIDKDIAKVVKDTLQKHGLSFGMTDDELIAYEDAEYNLTHPDLDDGMAMEEMEEVFPDPDPEEIPVHKIIPELKLDYTPRHIQQREEQKKEKPVLDYSLRMTVCNSFEAKTRKEVKDRLTNRSLMRIDADDIEWMKFHLFHTFFQSQPWYVRILIPKKTRIQMAKDETDEMLKEYIDSLVLSISKGLTEKFSSYLDKDWDEHWEGIMKEAGMK